MTVRGIACLALVFYHVVGPTSDNGMHLPEGSAWRQAMSSLDFLRMPTFALLAGFLYGSRRVTSSNLGHFLGKRAQRLGLPLLFATLFTVVARRMVYGDQTVPLEAIFFHYQHFWFLQAILLIYFCMAIWDSKSRPGWSTLLIVGFAATMLSRTFFTTTFLSFNGALYLLPYFIVGMILQNHLHLLARAELSRLAIALVVTVLVLQWTAQTAGGTEFHRRMLSATMCGIAGAYLMLVHCPRIAFAQWIGRYSYTIFLWHSISGAAVRHLLERLVVLPTALTFVVLSAVSILIPVAIHLVVQRLPGVSLLVAGIPIKKAVPGTGRRWLAPTNYLSARSSMRLKDQSVGQPLKKEQQAEIVAAVAP
ncbi:acyltransferase [Sphingomonas kaistensis]|uniref:Acyltransferase n=1 Tax=Sphingomonas kaistensis TaxID=298708 RepID=A0ABZ2G3I9_9SPHN